MRPARYFRMVFGCLRMSLALLTSLEARAATYNFYFNNSEQGDDSKANPKVEVKKSGNGDKESADADGATSGDSANSVHSLDDTTPTSASAPSTGPSHPTPVAAGETTEVEEPRETFWQGFKHHFRLATGWTANIDHNKNNTSNGSTDYNNNDSSSYFNDSSNNYNYGNTGNYSSTTSSSNGVLGLYLSGTYLISDSFAGTVTLGSYSGLEGEYDVGGHNRSGFQFALLAGAMFDGAQTSKGAAHIGASLGWKIGQHFAVILAGRQTLGGTSSGLSLTQFDSGMQYYF